MIPGMEGNGAGPDSTTRNSMTKEVGIFGGSFDPVHKGHLGVARAALRQAGLDEVWLMVSPENPLKVSVRKADEGRRVDMARLAVGELAGDLRGRIMVSDFELTLPRPSYTLETLEALGRAYPDYGFRWIIGGDNLGVIDKWRNAGEIARRFGFIVYPRPGASVEELSKIGDSVVVSNVLKSEGRNVLLTDVEFLGHSSTSVRGFCRSGDRERVEEACGAGVASYIIAHGLYGYPEGRGSVSLGYTEEM